MSEQNKPIEFWLLPETGEISTNVIKSHQFPVYHVIEYSAFQAEREKTRKLAEALKEIYRLDDEGDMYRTPFQNIAWKALEETEEA